MAFLIRFAGRRVEGIRCRPKIARFPVSGRLFADTSNEKEPSTSAFRGEPAAAVPNTPSPFQLTPEALKQQREVEEAARVPSSNRVWFSYVTRRNTDKNVWNIGGYTVKTLLVTFGRGCDTKFPDVESMSWEELFRMNKQKLAKIGMEPKERRYVHFFCGLHQRLMHSVRYILWCLEKFRQGEDPKEYAREPPPKKKHRGCVDFNFRSAKLVSLYSS